MITVIKKIVKEKEGKRQRKKRKPDKILTLDLYSDFTVLPQGHEGSLTFKFTLQKALIEIKLTSSSQ